MSREDDELRRLISEQAAEWHAAQGEGPLSPEQARELMRWLQMSPLHVVAYLSVAELEHRIAEAARADTTPLEALLAEPPAQVRSLPTDTMRRPHPGDAVPRCARDDAPSGPRRRKWVAGLAAALAVVVLAVVALGGWHLLGSGIDVETFTTQRGEERTTYLPDHTLLRLDAESRVVVRFTRTRRKVAVERGRAYFDVAVDPGRPFRVTAGDISIRDIGTAFEVYRHPAGITVTVVRGHVQVWDARARGAKAAASGGPPLQSAPSPGPLARLGPGECVRVSDSGRVLSYGATDAWQALAWTHGWLTFDGAPIAVVASRFNRYNASQIRVADPSIGAIRITGTFRSQGVASFIQFLEGLPGVAVTTHGQQVTVEASPRRR